MNEPVQLQVVRLDTELPLPSYARASDAGMDLFATENLQLAPGARYAMPTGIAVALPAGFVGLIHPRSGLALKHGLGMVNAPGTIDAGYRGEIKVILINHDREDAIDISRGERIAQLVVQKVETVVWHEVDVLDETERGIGGFGSTGSA